jgi:hypothetical protein
VTTLLFYFIFGGVGGSCGLWHLTFGYQNVHDLYNMSEEKCAMCVHLCFNFGFCYFITCLIMRAGDVY